MNIFPFLNSVCKSYQQQRRLSEVLSHVVRVNILPNEEQISYWSGKQNKTKKILWLFRMYSYCIISLWILLKLSLVSVGVGLFRKPGEKMINIDRHTHTHTVGCGCDWTQRADNLSQRAKQSSGCCCCNMLRWLVEWSLFQLLQDTKVVEYIEPFLTWLVKTRISQVTVEVHSPFTSVWISERY